MTEQNIPKPIYPFYYCGKLIGLVPFTIKSDCLKPSTLGSLYSLVFCMLYCTNCYYAINERFIQSNGDLSVGISIDYLQLTAGCFGQTVTWICTIIQQRKIINCVNFFISVENRLANKLDIDLNYNKNYKFAIFHQILLYGTLFICCAFVNTVSILNGFYGSIFFWLSYYGPLTGLWTNFGQYVFIVLIIRRRFQVLNKHLTDLKDKYPKATIHNIRNIINVTLAEKKDSKIGTGTNIKRKEHTFKKELPHVDVLRITSEIHDDLCEVCKMVSKAFGLQSLACIGFVFITLTCQMFYLIVLANHSDIIGMISSTVWLIIYLIPLLVLCGACHLCSLEGNQTGAVLHNIQNMCTFNEEFRTLATLFSLQLLHQQVKFSACGFFKIDFTLIQAILAAVTTYLVILLQFNAGGGKSTH